MFHIKIKELRNEKLTQQEVADYLGITRPAYTAYESGKRQPDFETLQNLLHYLMSPLISYLVETIPLNGQIKKK